MFAAVLGGLAFTACEDEPDKYEVAGGSPEVIYVRTPSNPDSIITSAYTNTRIVLIGNNLRSITKMYFNDKQAVLNSSLITDHSLFVTVPTALPTNPTDKIYMINNAGDTTTYDFTVDINAPVLTSMNCEQVKPGEVATINGDYILDYEDSPMTITMPDGTVITDFVECTQYKVSFVVPEGCTESGPITVTSKYGTTKSTQFEFNDNRGIMFDFDGLTGLGNHGWHAQDILSDETSISGNFVQLGNGTQVMSADGGWADGEYSFEYWCGSWDTPQNVTSGEGIALFNLVDFTDFANMALKFEMYIPSSNPWSAGAMQIAFEGYDLVTISGYSIEGYSGEIRGANAKIFNNEEDLGAYGRALYRPWESTGSFDTDNEWITVTVPISDFVYAYDGSASTWLPSSPDDFASLTMFVLGGGISGTECYPIIKMDNIRAVPYK